MPIEIGSEIEGKVTGVAPFGAFVELPEGKVGLVHISQVADTYVKDIGKHVKVGDIVKVKVLGLAKGDKYDLSIKQVGKPTWQQMPPRKRRPRDDKSKPAPGTFEDKITQFLKQSEDKLSDWKRNIENKQGGRKKKFTK
ncbi:S1 RNA-binding domain-containing protein [Candidatus Margulisiibacteriota bacterium]